MEILASELRIGNWYNHNGRYEQVTPNTILEVWESPRKWVQPIPLTPEILEKCGFVIDYQGDYMISFNGRVYYYGNGFIMKDFSIKTKLNQFPIQYLHQLQNLYFALTGEELNFKP